MEISDSPAFQAFLRARDAFGAEAGVRALDTAREISAVSWRLARLNTEAWSYMAHELLRCSDPLQLGPILFRQLHPTVQRHRMWQERVLDLLVGAQAEMAAIAESYAPTARYAAAPIAD